MVLVVQVADAEVGRGWGAGWYWWYRWLTRRLGGGWGRMVLVLRRVRAGERRRVACRVVPHSHATRNTAFDDANDCGIWKRNLAYDGVGCDGMVLGGSVRDGMVDEMGSDGLQWVG